MIFQLVPSFLQKYDFQNKSVFPIYIDILMAFSRFFLFLIVLLKIHSAISSDWVCYDLNTSTKYAKMTFELSKEGKAVFTPPKTPTKDRSQKVMMYHGQPEHLHRETLLYKGFDGRRQVKNTEQYPDSIHGQMSMSFSENEYGGSGVLVGPHHFLTAGHCIYDADTKEWAKDIKVRLGLNGTIAPFNETVGVKVYAYKRWIDDGNQEFDIALITLNRSVGFETGWAGLLSLEDKELSSQTVHVTGYPGDKGFKEMWTMDHPLEKVQPEQLFYKIDTYGGQSGGAVWIRKWGIPYVVGIHTNGGDTRNIGVRLSQKKLEEIVTKWIGSTGEIQILASSLPSISTSLPSSAKALNISSYTAVPVKPSASLASFSTVSSTPTPIPRPLSCIAIPEIARGYEEIYMQFLMGKLIYKPDPKSDNGRIDLLIRDLTNPLNGRFDLSRCGNTRQYLSISTGYRKGLKAENLEKTEVWLVPHFFIERELKSTWLKFLSSARHLQPIMGSWDAAASPVGLFWTYGGWNDLSWYDYLVTNSVKDFDSENLYKKWEKSIHADEVEYRKRDQNWGPYGVFMSSKGGGGPNYDLSLFYFEFKNRDI